MSDSGIFGDLSVSYTEFYVDDAMGVSGDLMVRWGFVPFATSGSADGDHYSVALRQSDVVLVVTEGRTDDHPASAYVRSHGSGVANIALRVPDAQAAHGEAMRRGAISVDRVPSSIRAFGDVTHTFVSSSDQSDPALPVSFVRFDSGGDERWIGLRQVDHFAVCLPSGELDSTIEFYQDVLGFKMLFAEHVVVGSQAMNSKVVQSALGAATFTFLEPDVSAQPGQIDNFLNNHGGAGVQHVAFSAENIVRAVGALNTRGVEFLRTPASYYDLLGQRLEIARHSVDDLRELNLLVDEDHDGQLFQIFAASTHPRRTFFFEVIERLGARTFGSGNIKALYEAVELERLSARVSE
ncbi:4-hydroxyphenylpyruvate dioxygenase [Amycolatopsis sp. NPDC059657]|uniref:4-hydroxyphenylpyruvate dioxygenase n=1 Tax=Amycolatopsis sp. NPDC059657 TaxID=3346899 RepID=UPI00366A82B1